MGRSLRIGSIKGVPIRIHWTFPLLVVLVVLPTSGRTTARSLAEGLIWIATLFVCIVVHELSHSFVARRRHFSVRDIVLLPIGGVSEISGLPGAPADELAIAIAGPLASVALALALALVAYASGAVMWPPTIFAGAIVSRLMWANLLLAGFNLVPTIPMDGGRVLRALLARRRTDYRATVIAAQLGRLIGLAMVLVGLRYDLWLSVIGLLVFVGAGSEKQAAAIRSAVGGLTVFDVMVHDPTTLKVSFPLSVVAPFLQASPGRVLPVVERGRYVGLIAADRLERSRRRARGRRHRSRRSRGRARRPSVPGRGGESWRLPVPGSGSAGRRPCRRCALRAAPRGGSAPARPQASAASPAYGAEPFGDRRSAAQGAPATRR